MRKPIIAGNWKMHKTPLESVVFVKELKSVMTGNEKPEVIVVPNNISIYPVCEELKGTVISVGAQNMHYEDSGAFTGESSADMILGAGCTHVVLGHSERRAIFGETDEMIGKKLVKAFEKGLVPILCVGELLEERNAGLTNNVLERQVKIALKGITHDQASTLVVAYEPVWAIGTGVNATKQDAHDGIAFIRSILKDLLGDEFAQKTRILYGGSVKASNIDEYMADPEIDGALVGGASLKKDEFDRIVHFQ